MYLEEGLANAIAHQIPWGRVNLESGLNFCISNKLPAEHCTLRGKELEGPCLISGHLPDSFNHMGLILAPRMHDALTRPWAFAHVPCLEHSLTPPPPRGWLLSFISVRL